MTASATSGSGSLPRPSGTAFPAVPRRDMTASPRTIVIVGPTASGKSALALELARLLGDSEIVSIDSMQVYRRMDIGTGKVTTDERAETPHHLLDLVEPSTEFSVSWFQSEARAVLADLAERGRRAILVGGTGLYHRAVDNRLMWGAGLATGSGVHHYVHHSSLASDGEFTNITNVGGGFFYIWDRVFRTYRPADHNRPPIGLTGDPALHENPIRLALSGMAQLAYELRHNRSARERALILLGHVSYAPPQTVDFAIKPAV